MSQASSTTRIVLGLSYHGQHFHGWQTQPGGNTVQDHLQHAIAQFTQHPLEVVCAGRTDSGVHAIEQVVHLDSPVYRSNESWVRGLNALLPGSIRIKWACPASHADFHARFAATRRSYLYVLRNDAVESALWQGLVGWDFHELNLANMQSAAQQLLGRHDFSCFRAAECQAHSPVRELYQLQIKQEGKLIFFLFQANAFLHHMVRNIMGALLYVGKGKHDPQWMQTLLAQKDRRLSAPTFMADGLYLLHVDYPSGAFSSPKRLAAMTQFAAQPDIATAISLWRDI
ncbi:tRNA pseudouridine(38-40) synthase TruA [Brackiella oedipodis]|uniref:tRNA pseudouridine(38-40) synthase TruA n=1 Tax=Brackiella oedipodis TaxID=124225 RepID=UPI000A06716F|nr:tRNA pseudouridine(38-40) synthase TruA [Brackiella oedipodis]